ncbi:MAG: hypothetical protein K6B74_03585 [Ruminococcus sp.]|nr:hypothetical protein [Ruminococcus sp.]
MHLYDPEFLFAFLPVFIGLYALLPSAKRPTALAIADLIFLYLAGKYELIGFLTALICAYFSGITIYNLRSSPEKEPLRRKLIGANALLCILIFIMLTVRGNDGAAPHVLSPAVLYMRAVIPLHIISYLIDVYRGNCAAQTSLSSLTAFAGFFPAVSFGPVMRYKCFEESFKSPKMSSRKMASGIRLYIFGLAEYIIIARRLETILTEIISAPDSLRGGTGWLFVPVFYTMFTVGVMGMIHMGSGVSRMLGFYIRPASRRTFFTSDMKKRLRQINEPLAYWLDDYIRKPIIKGYGKEGAALICAVCIGALWYGLSAGMFVTGLAVAGLIAFQSELYSNRVQLGKFAKGIITKLLMLLAAAVCALMQLPFSALKIFGSTSGSENTFLEHLVYETAIPLTFGLLISGAFLPQLVRRLNYVWLKAMIPVVETLIFIVSISFMLNIT